jgi:WD40 repeat protein
VAALRLRRRGIRWSLLVMFLVGLGLMLNAWLPFTPRCVIPVQKQVDVDLFYLSEDGGIILISGKRNEITRPIQIWDTHNGKNLHSSFVDSANIHKVGRSPDGRFFALHDPDLHLFDLKHEGEARKTLINFWGSELTFSPQGNFLAVTRERDQTAYLVDCKIGRVTKSFEELAFFRFLPDENAILMDGGKLVVCDPRTGKSIRTFRNFGPIDLSPDGQILLARSIERDLFLLDIETGVARTLRPAPFFWQMAIRAAFSPDGKTLVTYSGSELAVWDIDSGKQRFTEMRPQSEFFERVLFSPDSTFFLDGDTLRDSSTGRRVWKIETSGIVRGGGIVGPSHPIDICFTSDGRHLGISSSISFEVIDAKTGKTTKSLLAVGSPPVLFGSTGVIETTYDRSYFSVREMPDQDPGLLQKLLGDWWPWGTKNNPDDRKITVFETATERIVGQLHGPYGNGHLSSDGRSMVTAYREKDGSFSLRCWDLPLRPSLRLVVGIPLGIGLFFVLVSWSRGRRRAARLKQQPGQ